MDWVEDTAYVAKFQVSRSSDPAGIQQGSSDTSS